MTAKEKKELYERLTSIGKKFRLEGIIYSFDVLNEGHINTTIKVTYRRPDQSLKSFLFQKVNTYVFKNPERIMDNIDKVTGHIRQKSDATQVSLHFHHTTDGLNYYYTEDGEFWRVMNYIESVTYNITDDFSIISGVGKAFGQFQRNLVDFDGKGLFETIPDFHNTRKRIDDFLNSYYSADTERSKEISEEVGYIESIKETACKLWDDFAAGKLPVRVTHNDTKANNVLFDVLTKKPLVVIDLDTVMPGMAGYDFGDAVRFIANNSVEDEPELSKVFLDRRKFSSLADGYLSEVSGRLTEREIDTLVLASFSITVELAARFLEDYIKDDVYFKTDYPMHNLVRARCQLNLAKDIYNNMDDLQEIIRYNYKLQIKKN